MRRFPLPKAALAALRAHRAAQNAERLAAGEHWVDRGVVFARDDGQYLDPDTLSMRAWPRLAAAAGLPGVRLHELRHSFVSLAIDAGVPVQVVSAMVGHASLAVTAGTYLHSDPALLQLAADAIDRLVG